ncbi:MAG: peptidylprolyl isomerase [Sphingomonadales bacterium]|nr:peptidylprolyl isomerase [Sphingomonadales bacterium]MDE2168214.1 peptidylprolyl isomerase [Sphingomonadales bacterium]
MRQADDHHRIPARLLGACLGAAMLVSAMATFPARADQPARPKPLSAGDVVKAAPASAWVAIAPQDLLVMTLAPDAKGKARQVIIQLMPAPFSQGWVGNVRKLAAAHWWDGLSVYRVQDNWVAQWGDGEGEDKAKAKPLPEGLVKVDEKDYVSNSANFAPYDELAGRMQLSPTQDNPSNFKIRPITIRLTGFVQGWPVGIADTYGTYKASYHSAHLSKRDGELVAKGKLIIDTPPPPTAWPVHCYATVGVARDLSPDTGTGAELYAVIGQPPRQLDRNIAVVGRVIEGIANLSSLPRAPGNGVYKDIADRTPILSVRLASELPADQQPHFEYLSTDSSDFARYVYLRAHRQDDFIKVPAAGADICSIPVPIRRHPSS